MTEQMTSWCLGRSNRIWPHHPQLRHLPRVSSGFDPTNGLKNSLGQVLQQTMESHELLDVFPNLLDSSQVNQVNSQAEPSHTPWCSIYASPGNTSNTV